MKVIHGSLQHLIDEVKERKVDTVRVAGFVQSDVAPANGSTGYTACVVVTAVLGWDVWAEWRLLVERGQAEVTARGTVVPARIAELLNERAQDIRARLIVAGLSVEHGMVAHDAEALEGALD
jgi:hypothetical protein